jgi:uncharacterized Zn-binding protein involved in type VI secretion
MSRELVSFLGYAVTSHGGTLGPAIDRHVHVDFSGDNPLVALDGDFHYCPIHGVNNVIGTGFAKYNGVRFVRVGDSCSCGAVVVVGSDHTFSDED